MRSFLLITIAVTAALTSCTHKELCLSHHHTARVRIRTDWSEFTVEKPTGMSVHVYGEDGEEMRRALSNNTAFVDMELVPGFYDVMVFNQSPSEFGTIRFEKLDSRKDAAAMGELTKSLWFKADEEPVISEPEWFGTEIREGLEVSSVMMQASPQIRKTRSSDFPEANTLVTMVPRSIIYTISVTVKIRGIYNLKAARASLSGLAAGYKLGEGHQTEATATELMETWTMTREASDPTIGYVHTEITSFGLPWRHSGTKEDNVLSLSLLLVDNKTKIDCTFQCGDSFVEDKENGMKLNIYKEADKALPDVKPEGGSSGGFDAKVDDWGDEEIIDIPV